MAFLTPGRIEGVSGRTLAQPHESANKGASFFFMGTGGVGVQLGLELHPRQGYLPTSQMPARGINQEARVARYYPWLAH